VLKKAKTLFSSLVARDLGKFRNQHQGESCYIFGDGPSLKWFDLKHFGDMPAICCGMLPFHNDFAKLDVRYCLLVEPWAFVPIVLKSRFSASAGDSKITDAYRSVISHNPERMFFLHISNMFSVRQHNVRFVFRRIPETGEAANQALRRFNLFGGSFHASLTLAYWLGFSRIFLLGFDAWTIQPARNLHWYEFGQGIIFEPTNFARDFLSILETTMEIRTIAFDGSSRNVECISYEDYTGEKPSFRENHELATRDFLSILSTYPNYRIFPE
jgi:hypothetical protein